VVRTFTRMALPPGRRNHFCLLALGVPQLVNIGWGLDDAKKVLSREEKRDQYIRRMTTWVVGPIVIFFFLIWLVHQ
jgi:hypothetical protein